MLYFELENGKAVRAVSKHPDSIADYTYRGDFKTFADAERIASELNDAAERELYIATDAGEFVYPRYDVVRLPQVGDKVSRAFNGDYYPEGEIVSISASKRVVTVSSGVRYFRRKKSGSWVMGGMWSLVPGHVDKRNPEF